LWDLFFVAKSAFWEILYTKLFNPSEVFSLSYISTYKKDIRKNPSWTGIHWSNKSRICITRRKWKGGLCQRASKRWKSILRKMKRQILLSMHQIKRIIHGWKKENVVWCEETTNTCQTYLLLHHFIFLWVSDAHHHSSSMESFSKRRNLYALFLLVRDSYLFKMYNFLLNPGFLYIINFVSTHFLKVSIWFQQLSETRRKILAR